MKNLITTTFILILYLGTDSFARLNLVVFPFRNLSNDDVFSWISAVVPETAYRSLFTVGEVRLIDPVFIFQTDSTGWEMNPDSLVVQHKKRWQWNAAIGGNYAISNDSVFFNVKISWSSDDREPEKIEFNGADNVKNCRELGFELLKKVFLHLSVPFPEKSGYDREGKSGNSITAYGTYAAGYLFEMKGNIAAASTAYSRALEIEPDLIYAGCRLGRMLYLQRKFDEAKKLYGRFLNRYPDDPMLSAFMIEAMGNSENLQEASQMARRLKNSLSSSSKGLCASGYIHLRQGEFHRAIALLSQAKAAGPENLDVDFYLGQAMLLSGDYERAIEIFNQLIRYCPENPRYYASLGAVYKKSGQLMQASIAMKTSLAKNNSDISVMIDLSQIWIEMKDFRNALHILDKAMEINPEIPDIYINKAIALWHTGDIAESKKILNSALKYSSVKQTALVNIGNIHFFENDYRKALTFYKKAYAIEKQNPPLEFNIAISYQKLGKLSKALYHYDQYLALSDDKKDILLRCSDISMELKRYDDAIGYLKRILEITPQDKSVVKKLSGIYLQLDKMDEAVKILEESLAYSPSSSDLTVQLANSYRSKGWAEVALHKYLEIISSFPELPDGYVGLGICMAELVKSGKRSDVANTLAALKFAIEKAPSEPLVDILSGDLYLHFEGNKKMALEHWNSALKKTENENERKKILKKINSIK